MILPREEFPAAVALARKWVEEDGAKIIFLSENGCVLLKDGALLSIRVQPQQADITWKSNVEEKP